MSSIDRRRSVCREGSRLLLILDFTAALCAAKRDSAAGEVAPGWFAIDAEAVDGPLPSKTMCTNRRTATTHSTVVKITFFRFSVLIFISLAFQECRLSMKV